MRAAASTRGGAAISTYSPGQLARLLGLPEPTPEQAAVIAAPLEPMVVAAGAGSGKSETMAARVVWLVANGLVRPERVLGLTFTRKAAGELSERVRRRLDGLRRAGLNWENTDPGASRAAGPDAGAGAGAGQGGAGGSRAAGPPGHRGVEGLPTDGTVSGQRGDPPGPAQRAQREEDDPLAGEPTVCTYHAYAGRLVADHALREAVEPSLRLITPAVQWQIAAKVAAGYEGPVDKITWTPASVTAAVLELAGELAEHLRTPDEVRAVGLELARQAAALPRRGAVGGRTRGNGRHSGGPGSASRGGAGVSPGGAERPPGLAPSAAVKKILATQAIREQLLPIVTAFGAAKAAREVIDFGDQIALAARIAVRHPAVGAAERGRYQVVLLDEYQDTSHAQLVLLRALFGGGHPVTAVGDPCQSIYGWRGASAGNLRRFRTDFSTAAGRTLDPREPPARQEMRVPKLALLSTSFRNAARILDVAAALQADLRAEAAEVPRLVPARDRSGRGMAACALLPAAAGEAEWIAQRLTRLLSMPPGVAPDGQPWPDGRKDKVRPSDIAVLCRKRSQFPVLRRAIEERGIPVEVVGLGGLLTVPEVQDVVATLRVMHDPAASDAVARLLTGPRWRIGPADLVALGRRARVLAAASSPRRGGGPGGGDARGAPGAADDEGDIHPGGEDGAPADPVSEAIADMTAESASLVEALDDLGDPSKYSAAGYARLSSLAAELRALRGQVGQPLPDLVLEVERALGLDIEVAARPGADPAAARADLDAFADAAAAFAGDDEEPTLGAFLSYLAAAEAEEFGLEAGRVGESDSVKLMTVHAAKGLQWPAVFVPGFSAGEKAQLFPARPRVCTRWTENPRKLPFGLRGDAVDLPGLAGLDEASLEAFTRAARERDLREERRLAYVAATRAAFWLGCSGFWWGDGVAPLGPSVFLEEVRAACEAGAGRVWSWAPAPEEGAENPVLAEEQTAPWPASPSGSRYDAAVAAAAMVEQQIAALTGASSPAPGFSKDTDHSKRTDHIPLTDADRALIAAWRRDASLLLAERAARRGHAAVPVDLPSRLSVSSLVSMARDPDEFARHVRRPMPHPPAPQARRGTAFHRWLENRFGQQHLLDPDELPGAADEWVEADEADLLDLRARFEAGQWAVRVPAEVEVPFETVIGDRLVRGRIDAVFHDGADGFDVVDWKTGRSPQTAEESQAVAVQLAAYRLAWASLAHVPLEKVRAAFYYVREDLTVRPADVLDEAGLEALVMGVPAP
jgi:DNA helicase-2/ATP-dependent DNA helicase PcrA